MDDKLWWTLGWILLSMLRTVCCLARSPAGSRNGFPIEFINGAKGSILELKWPDTKKKGSLNLATRKDFGDFVPLILENSQRSRAIDLPRFESDVNIIRKILGVHDLELSVWFCGPQSMREYNYAGRGKSRVTDILSFRSYEFKKPMVIQDKTEFQEMKYLGDIMIEPMYVQRVMQRDQKRLEENIFDDDDRGVSRALATEFDYQNRLSLLMIHGMLHLLGYDHESDDEWIEMTAKEDQVMRSYLVAKAGLANIPLSRKSDDTSTASDAKR